MIIFLLQQANPTISPAPREFDAGIVWRAIADLGNGFLAQLPFAVKIRGKNDVFRQLVRFD